MNMKSLLPVAMLLATGLLTSCGGVDKGGGFSVQVSGGNTAAWSADDGRASLKHVATETPKTYSLHFSNKGNKLMVAVIFASETPPAAGKYTFGPQMGAGVVNGLYVDNRAKMESYTAAEGTLELTKEGDTYAGKFEFRGQGGPIGGGQKDIAASGTFQGVK